MPPMTLADPANSPPMSLPPRLQQTVSNEGQHLAIAQHGDAREAAKAPIQLETDKTNLEEAQLKLRVARVAAGLDPDTGKPASGPGANKVGDAVLADFSPGDQDIIKGIAMGKVPISQYALARNPKLYQLTQAAFAYDPGTDLTTFQRRSVAFQKFMSNPNTPMARVNQALQHLGRFAENVKALHNSSEGLTNPLNLSNYASAAYKSIEKDPQFETTATDRDALATELAAAFQGSGQGGALADRQEWQKRLSLANTPEGFDKIVKEAVGLLGGRIETSNQQFKQAVGANAGFYDLMSPAARKVFEQYAPDDSAPDTPPADQKTLSTTEKVVDIPAGYQEAHQAFLKAHPPGTLTAEDYQKLRATLDHQFSDQLAGATSHMSPEEVDHFVEQYNKGHGVTTKIPAINVPLSDKGVGGTHLFSEKAMAGAADSSTGMLVSHAADAGSFGLGELLLSPEEKQAFADASNAHPVASGIGEVAGTIPALGGIEQLGSKGIKALENINPKVFEKLGIDINNPTTRTKLLGDILVNTASGTDRGFTGAEPGSRGEGALKGGAGGVVAALGGNLITKGVTPLISEAKQAALAKLSGLDLTTLQRLGFGKGEAAISSIPLSHGAQTKAAESFNRQNATRALQNLDPALGVERAVPKTIAPGTATNNFVNQQLNKAYSVIKPQITGVADGTFDTQMTLLKAAADTPAKKQMFKEITSAVQAFKDKDTGAYTGESYQAASEKLRGVIKDLSAQAENGTLGARDMARVADQARKQMQFLIQRNNPAVAAQLKGIERGYAHSMRIEDASLRNLGSDGVYSPGQYLTSVKKLDTSANKGFSARGKAFGQDYGQAGAEIMGSEAVPKKVNLTHTFYTMTGLGAATVGAGVAGSAAPVAGFIAGVTAGLYGAGVKRVLQKVLTGQRPSELDNSIARKAWEGFLQNQTRPGN